MNVSAVNSACPEPRAAMWASIVMILCTMCDAARMSLHKQRSAASMTMTTGSLMRMELALVHKQESQIYSDIEKVKTSLETALVEISQLVEHPSANSTNTTHETKKTIVSKAHSEITQKVHAGISNSTAATPATNKSSKVVAAVGKTAKVQAVIQAQQTILENLFQHLKGNIVNLNKEESSSKDESQKQIKRLEARLNEEETKLARKDISKFEHEDLVNRTRTDKVELQFWTHERSLGHSMWHTNLKMQHGLMSRVKSVIDVCKEAVLKGRVDPGLIKKLQKQAVPTAFVQMRSAIEEKTQQYYTHVLSATDWATWMSNHRN